MNTCEYFVYPRIVDRDRVKFCIHACALPDFCIAFEAYVVLSDVFFASVNENRLRKPVSHHVQSQVLVVLINCHKIYSLFLSLHYTY